MRSESERCHERQVVAKTVEIFGPLVVAPGLHAAIFGVFLKQEGRVVDAACGKA